MILVNVLSQIGKKGTKAWFKVTEHVKLLKMELSGCRPSKVRAGVKQSGEWEKKKKRMIGSTELVSGCPQSSKDGQSSYGYLYIKLYNRSGSNLRVSTEA